MDDHYHAGARSAASAVAESTDPAPLPVLQAGGFGASVDIFAWEPDPVANPQRMRLWLVSLLGSRQAVKALWAQLIKGETATLSPASGSARFCALAPEGARSWRFFRASLPAASAYHVVVVPEMALYAAERSDFLLLRRPDDDAALLHYRFLNRRAMLPLHPTWADWLWKRALRTGEARALESRGLEAYRCVPDEAALAVDLTAAIRQGAVGLADEPVGHSRSVVPSRLTVGAREAGHGPT